MTSLFSRAITRLIPPAPTTQMLTERAGFYHEIHHIVTQDGYRLGLSRIQAPNSGGILDNRPVCLILHGLMSCSDFFVCQLPNQELGEAGLLENKSLPFFLASRGYDVWLLNNRGARYSCDHARLFVDSDEFWDFSWCDMARYDLPAAVDYVLRTTAQTTLALCAFSQGTAQVMAALSMHLDLVSQVRTIILFSPVLVPRVCEHPIITYLVDRPALISRIFGRRSLLAPVELTRALLPDWVFAWICYQVAGMIFGWRMDHITGVERRIMYQNLASTTSVKVLTHWIQVAVSKTFSDAETVRLSCLPLNADIAIYAVMGKDDGLPDHDLFHDWFGEKKINTLVVDRYEHIETIWGRDWSVKVGPFIHDAVQEDLKKWKMAKPC